MAGIDRERWTIAGLDIDVVDKGLSVTVYAFEAGSRDGVTGMDAAGIREELPVTAFPVASEGVQDFLDESFGQLSIRLTASPYRDQVFVIRAPG